MTSLPASFVCSDGVESVSYTLVCDHREDCGDASDENFCVHQPCRGDRPFRCGHQQCVELEKRCDGHEDCADGVDEKQCNQGREKTLSLALTRPHPAVVNFDGTGNFNVEPLPLTDSAPVCPETHFQCLGNGYCVPVYVRCNGVYDCPTHEDEADCDTFTCPGLYRCRGVSWCLHFDYMCDGVYHCPQQDDEMFCDLDCSMNCTCHGLAFICPQPFRVHLYPQLRYLDAKGSGMTLQEMTANRMLIHLSLVHCKLHRLGNITLPNLRSLDLSENELDAISVRELTHALNLRVLILNRNPLTSLFTENVNSIPSLKVLDLSSVLVQTLNGDALATFPNLKSLNLSYSKVQIITKQGFQSVPHLFVLDLRGCSVEDFPQQLFQGLTQLSQVHADNYKLCCPAMLPKEFNLINCHAPHDEISSCEALLRSDTYRFFLVVFAIFSLTGNLVSFVIRVSGLRGNHKSGFGIFVTNLALADFLMGIYLAIIGVADRLYFGTYLWEENTWRESVTCKIAGFLSLTSSEVSAFIICFITLDRFLVIRFPFSQMHFGRKSAQLTCAAIWSLGFLLAAIPLLQVTLHWRFYGQTGICIPLPITKNDYAGYNYAFGVIIVLNFVLFLLIAVGQASVYISIRNNRMAATDTSRKSQDLSIARRLITIAVSDFLCWFPIGLLGLLASSGFPISSEVNVSMAIVVLPLNSALNPFLYTLNMVLEKRRRVREERLLKILQTRIPKL